MSIPANIGEGAGRSSRREYARFLDIALGSANELESHIVLAAGVAMLSSKRAEDLVVRAVQVRRMLLALRRRVVSGLETGTRDWPTDGRR